MSHTFSFFLQAMLVTQLLLLWSEKTCGGDSCQSNFISQEELSVFMGLCAYKCTCGIDAEARSAGAEQNHKPDDFSRCLTNYVGFQNR